MRKKHRSSLSVFSTLFAVCLLLVLAAALAFTPIAFAAASTVTFDFDTGAPTLVPRQNTPVNQTFGGMTAYFSSISGPNKFSVQNILTNPNIQLSQLQGMYMYDNTPSTGDSVDIKFSVPLSSINFTFATFEFHGPVGQDPSNMTLTAYLDSNASLLPWLNSTYLPPVGSVIARGVWPTNDSYPQGTLLFNSTQQFNLVRIQLPYQGPNGAVGFAFDNVIATTLNEIPEFTPAIVLTLLIANTALVMLIAKKKGFKTKVATII